MINVKVDTSKTRKMLENITVKQLPYAITQAINNTAFKVKDAEVKALGRHLDRPTPFTQSAYEVVKANKARLIATIKARPIQEQYLQWQVDGGSRAPRRMANVVPTANQSRNAYGNMTKGAIKSMLGKPGLYFSGTPRGYTTPGIWKRTGSKRDRAKGNG